MPKRSTSSPRSSGLASWLPPASALLWVLGAFVAGLLLFAVVWLVGRDDSAAEPAVPAVTDRRVDEARALPAPLPARNGQRRIERRPPPAAQAEPPSSRLVETAPSPPPPDPLEQPTPAPSAAEATGDYASPTPIPGQTPSPDYPARALRRRESGTVLVRAEIDPSGRPVAVDVERSSGSRALDRAAEDAVRRWRFQPARRGGQPTTGSVIVPITFDPR